MIQQMLKIWSLVPLPFLNPAWTPGSFGFTYCWSLAWRILSITLLACAAAAKSLQSCLTLCDPIDGSPPGCSVPGILQARILEWVASVRWVQLCGSLNILWHCLSLGLEWKLTFSSPVATAEFSKLGKDIKAVYCHPAYLTYMQSTSCEMPGCMKHSWNQDCWKKRSITSDMHWHHPDCRKWRGTEEPLDKSERVEW